MNLSFIMLIPKDDSSLSLNDFRPISPVVYLNKIVSKSLVARLSKVLEEVISDAQSTFLTG